MRLDAKLVERLAGLVRFSELHRSLVKILRQERAAGARLDATLVESLAGLVTLVTIVTLVSLVSSTEVT